MGDLKGALLCFLLFIYSTGWSQKLEFEHISDKDGLVNSSITSIVKDSYGYMWFGTFNGLSRYDGYSFTNYFNDPSDSNSLTDNYVRFIFESKDRTLFIGFEFGGICTFNRDTETFTRYRHIDGDKNSLSHDYVLTIYGDRKGNVWIGTRAGLDKFDPKTRTFLHYAPLNEDNYFVSAISEDENNNLWLYGRGDHVYKFNPEKNDFRYITFASNYNFENSFSWGGALQYDSKGNLWIGSEGYGLYRYNTVTGEKAWYSVRNNKLSSDIIFKIIEDSDGKIWIGTDGGGLYLYSRETDAFEQLKHDPADGGSLSGDGIYSIYESDPGVVWVGVFGAGLNIYKKYKRKFLKYTSAGMPGYCLSNKSVVSIAESGDGKILLGTDGGGLDVFDPLTKKFRYYTTRNSIIHSDKIKSIFIDSDNNWWLGSYGKGLCRVNFEKGTIRTFTGNIHSKGETILHNHVWAIKESSDRKIWIGLLNFGINVYDPQKDKFLYYPYDTSAFNKAVSNIYVIFRDSKNRMWIGTETSGAGYFQEADQRFVQYRSGNGKPGKLSSNNIHDIFEDSKGNIWLATFGGGLNKLVNQEKEIFECYTVKEGLPTNNIQNILEDQHGNLWLSTDKGISLFRVNERKFINFDMEDGLQSKEFNYKSAVKTKDGYMYFGGIQGFNMFHPDSIYYNTKPPAVTITDFKIFNRSIFPNKEYNGMIYLKKAINVSQEVTLNYEDHIFSLEFAALDFTSPQKNRYAYRLKGFSDQWTYVNADKRFANYTNLDPGKYVFQVIACNNDGYWNKTGVSLKIVILPPWWMTWWFRSFLTLLVVMLLVSVYYFRLRSIEGRNRFLEEEVRKRTAELERANVELWESNGEILEKQKEILAQKDQLEMGKTELERKQQELEYLNKTKDKFFSIIGHDLKGPVRALTSLTTLLKEEPATMLSDKQKLLINHIDSSSNKIQNLVLSLLDWARAQSRQIKVNKSRISVQKLFSENRDLLLVQAAQKEIQIFIEPDEAHEIFADYNMITTIIRNILSNSIKYTPRGGSIRLSSFSDKEGKIRLSIMDNGIGMHEDILNKLFSFEKKDSVKGTDNEVGTGLGMIIAKEFAEINNGKIYAESTLGKGSVFYLILPASDASAN